MRSVIIDTNLAILLVVGTASPDFITKHHRLSGYDALDFRLLLEFLGEFDQITFIPHTLAETSNLVRQKVREPLLTKITATLAALVNAHTELYVRSTDAVSQMRYQQLGLTDAALLCLGDSGGELLTVDAQLYLAAVSARFSATNFNHVRESRRPDFNG